MQKLEYRADIDGLRAIAVLSVVLFHFNSKLVPGGFVGVDIFFVISGFLITKIIGTEILNNSFSFKSFYVRRIRRILPVFLAVIATTMIAGKILFLSDDLASLLVSVKYALLFGINIYFSKDRGYFDLASDEKPLLHIWSLSIEEQYYLIWPLMLIALYMIARYIFGPNTKYKKIFAASCTFFLIIVDFVLTQKALQHTENTTKLYFLLQTRFGELMIGSLTAIMPHLKKQKTSDFIGILGLCGVFFAICTLNKENLFPGYNALTPCFATGLVLYTGQSGYDKKNFSARILSLSVLVYIGLLSYSIYLWHWPILAFMRYIYGHYTLPFKWNLTAILLICILSHLSYFFLEKKIKHTSMTFSKALFGIYVIPCILLLAICSSWINEVEKIQTEKNLTTYGTDVCHGNFNKNCIKGYHNAKLRVLMIGDSHAAALNAFVEIVGKKEGWSAKVLSASSCSPVFGFDEKVLPKYAQQPCQELKQYVSENYQKYDAIFIASYWAFQLGWTDIAADKNYLNKFRKTLEVIAKNKPIYVFSDVPELPISPFRLAHFKKIRININRAWSQQYVLANDIIKKTAISIPNVHWVNLMPALQAFNNYGTYHNQPTYFDKQHLNRYGSKELGYIFSNSQQTILTKQPFKPK